MCMAQLLSPADMVDVAAGLTHEEEGDLFSIVTSARKYEAVGAISSSSSRKQKLLFFDAMLCLLSGWDGSEESSLESLGIYIRVQGRLSTSGSSSTCI